MKIDVFNDEFAEAVRDTEIGLVLDGGKLGLLVCALDNAIAGAAAALADGAGTADERKMIEALRENFADLRDKLRAALCMCVDRAVQNAKASSATTTAQ